MSRQRDYPYEMLAESTDTDMTAGRGELNAALKSIKQQADIDDPYLLAQEIRERAKLYRSLMPEVMLTPSALAKHWKRVLEAAKPKRVQHPSPPPLPDLHPDAPEEVRKLMNTLWGNDA